MIIDDSRPYLFASTPYHKKSKTMKNHYLTVVILLLALGLMACGSESETRDESASYDTRGIFLSLDADINVISVAHEDIPEVMNAMRMNLRIDSPELVSELEPGDKISFRLARVGMQWYARSIEALPPDTELELPDQLRAMLPSFD